jgi:hypothetical protein
MMTKVPFSVFLAACSLALYLPSFAADLKPKTSEAFNRYVAVTETRISGETKPGGEFLYPDRPAPEPSEEMRDAYARLKRGEILVERQETKLIAAHTISHQGDDYRIFMRLYQKRFTTVVFNTEYAIHWGRVDDKKLFSNSVSTRVAEVKDPNRPDGDEVPIGHGNGYLWRLNTYWRFEEKDGGVYVQCEAVSLTRDIPFGLGWLIKPLVTKIPKQSLDRALGRTREAVLEKIAASH